MSKTVGRGCSLEPSVFRRFATIIYDASGIYLTPGKTKLLEARIGKRLKILHIDSYAAYLDRLDADPTELVGLLNVVTTNYTSFFREPDHFVLLADLIREGIAHGQKRFRFWCAASSSGEEPYSMAMTILEAAGNTRIDLRILATDIATDILERARSGIYSIEQIKKLPIKYQERYFQPAVHGRVVVCPHVRRLLLFKHLNLAKPPFDIPSGLDAVFCRNVMIYFDDPVRQNLIQEVERILRPGGLLALGHTETLSRVRSGLRCVRASVYQRLLEPVGVK